MQLVLLAVVVAVGFAGYREAEKFERQTGKGPWGGSAILWSIVCSLLGLIGLLLLYIAERNTKKQARANAMWPPSQYSASPAYGTSAYGDPPAPAAGQWAPPPPPSGQWASPSAPSIPPGPPRPNVGGTDIIPGPH